MAYVCEICGKRKVFGRSQKHRRGVAGKRWRKRAQSTSRVFKPNLQNVTLELDGNIDKFRVCSKCLKAIKKFGKVKGIRASLVQDLRG